jgi:hypothetical protein
MARCKVRDTPSAGQERAPPLKGRKEDEPNGGREKTDNTPDCEPSFREFGSRGRAKAVSGQIFSPRGEQ